MEDKVSIREIAEESGATHAEVIAKAADLSIIVKSPQSKLTYEQAEEIVNYIVTGKSDKIKTTSEPKAKSSSVTTNTATKKSQPKAKVEVISEPKVEQIISVVKKQEDEVVQEEENDVRQVQSIAEGEAPLKRGKLTIVKKKRPVDDLMERQEQPKKQSMKSMSELFGSTPDNKEEFSPKIQQPKVKKQVKKVPQKAHMSSEKIDVFNNSNDELK